MVVEEDMAHSLDLAAAVAGVAGVVSHAALALGVGDAVVVEEEVHSASTGLRGLDLGVAVRMRLGVDVAVQVGKIVVSTRMSASRTMSGDSVGALLLLDPRGSPEVVRREGDSLGREVVIDLDRRGCRR